MLKWPRHVARFCFMGLVGMTCVFLYGIGRLGTLFILDASRRRAAVARLKGRLLRSSMATLGATFIKLGQVMSTRPDLLAPEIIEELRKLQDKLPPFAFRHVRARIEADLGRPVEACFAELDPRPVAAASVAQVHRGRLHDGTEVAVKVLRPDVRRKVERDAALLIGMARFLALFPRIRLSDPVGHLQYFVAGIIEQTDLRIEARNNAVFQRNFKTFPDVVFPRLYLEVSGENVLTMEFYRGRKVDELGPGDHVRQAVAIRNAFFKMCFEDGVLHADLHPGNLLVLESGEVAVFDLGLVLHIEEELLRQFVDFAKCVSMGTPEDFVNHLRTFHTYLDGVDWDAVTHDAVTFVTRFRQKSVTELEWGAFINNMFALARQHKIRPLPELVLVFVGVVTSEGLGKLLNPHGNSFQEMASFILPIVQRRGLLAAR